ncbi:MAG: hypothetical protein QOJ25_396 [Solirubrobacteraceae bacterium]|nr:hypothetical protein [Solirubrobacteraceae bacterium]
MRLAATAQLNRPIITVVELSGTPLDDDEDARRTLREVVIAGTSAELCRLGRFLHYAADEIDADDEEFAHAHLLLFEIDRHMDLGHEDWGGEVTVLHPRCATRQDRGDPWLASMPPLVRAARVGDAQSTAQLLEDGVDPDSADEDGYSALEAACDASTAPIVRSLLDAGADVDAGSAGNTPLMRAAAHGSTEIVEMLLAAGADIHAVCDAPGPDTALASAATFGHIEIVRRLLQLGALPDGGDPDTTPLMVAAEEGNLELVKLLLDAGADPFVTQEGQTPLDSARTSGHDEVVALLKGRMG